MARIGDAARVALVATFGVGCVAVSIAAANPTTVPAPHGTHRVHDPGVRVYTYVPAPANVYGHPDVYFYGRDRIEVPGAVTINAPPYVCDLDEATFGDKLAFVAHLRTTHSARLREAASPFVVSPRGQVHFVGQ
jgi:hypothetical protein